MVKLPDWTEDGLDYTQTANYTDLQAKLKLSWAKRRIFAAALNIIDTQTKRIYEKLDELGYLGGSKGEGLIRSPSQALVQSIAHRFTLHPCL